MVKQRSSMSFNSFPPPEFGEDELDVAGILLELPRLISISNFGSLLPSSWGSKRRRSAEDKTSRRLSSLPQVPQQAVVPSPTFEPEEKPSVKDKAPSPATPLSFSPSESDEIKPKRLKRKISVKKTKEELKEIIEQQSQNKELLKNEIQKLICYIEQLRNYNLALKARKQQLIIHGVKSESLNLEMKLGLATVKSSEVDNRPDHHHNHPQIPGGQTIHQVPTMIDLKGIKQETAEAYPVAMSMMATGIDVPGISSSDVGPRGIPYLNLNLLPPVVESHPTETTPFLDGKNLMSKIIAARARQRRMMICRDKNSNSSTISKHRLSFR